MTHFFFSKQDEGNGVAKTKLQSRDTRVFLVDPGLFKAGGIDRRVRCFTRTRLLNQAVSECHGNARKN